MIEIMLGLIAFLGWLFFPRTLIVVYLLFLLLKSSVQYRLFYMAFKKEINWDMVEMYVKSDCSQTEIADSLFIDRDTLRDRVKEKYGMDYSAFSASLRSEGVMLIKAKQFKKAMDGYWPALQWLGKVRVGQREPETLQLLAANQSNIDQTHRIMELEHELAERKANADKPEAK